MSFPRSVYLSLLGLSLTLTAFSVAAQPSSAISILFWSFRQVHTGEYGKGTEGETGQVEAIPLWNSVIKNKIGKESDPLVIVAGGALAGSSEAYFTRGSLLVKVLNRMGVHVLSPGWEDLTWGVKHLKELEKSAQFKIVVGNLAHLKEGSPFLTSLGMERAGIFLTLTTLVPPWILECVMREKVKDYRIIDPLETARFFAQSHTSPLDFKVIISHLGWRADSLIATLVPGIDLIIENGDHSFTYESQYVGKTLIVGCNPQIPELYLLTIPKDRDGINRGGISVEKIPVTNPQAETDTSFTRWWKMQQVKETGGKRLGRINLGEKEGTANPLDAIALAIRLPTNSPLSLVERNLLKAPLGPEITERELHRSIPYDVPVIVTQVEGWEVRQLVTEQIRSNNQRWGWDGLKVLTDPQSNSILNIEVGNQPLIDSEYYALVAPGSLWYHWGTLTGLKRSGRPQFQLNTTVSDLIKEALKRKIWETPRPSPISP
ncbi:MAG: hypothetical protein ACK4OO_03155 [bacterium]